VPLPPGKKRKKGRGEKEEKGVGSVASEGTFFQKVYEKKDQKNCRKEKDRKSGVAFTAPAFSVGFFPRQRRKRKEKLRTAAVHPNTTKSRV